MIDQLTIIKTQLHKIVDNLTNYPEARDAINHIIAANQNLAKAKVMLSNIKEHDER